MEDRTISISYVKEVNSTNAYEQTTKNNPTLLPIKLVIYTTASQSMSRAGSCVLEMKWKLTKQMF